MSTCPKCGAELDNGAKFCMECGTSVPQNKKCIKCGIELPFKAKFCFGCGAPQDGSSPVSAGINMGDKNVISGDVIGQKIAGDNVQSKIMGNLVNNVFQDETKKVLSCHICGKHLTNDSAHTCPKCGKIVCKEHFNQRHNCCRICFKKEQNEFIVDINGNGDFTSISDAIKSAQDGTTILVKSGVYREHFIIDKKIILQGDADKDSTPIIWNDSATHNSVITIAAEAEIINLKIMGQQEAFSEEKKAKFFIAERPNELTPAEYWPKCIHVKSTCHLNGVEVCYSAGYGIALRDAPLSISLKNCKVHDNVRAGLYSNAESGSTTKINIDMSSFSFNLKGLILNSSNVSLVNSSVSENDFGLFIDSCEVNIASCEFYSNRETAIYAQSNSNCFLRRCIIGATKNFADKIEECTESDFPSIWHNGNGITVESCSKLSTNECYFFDSIDIESCNEIDLQSSTFAVSHNQNKPNYGISFKGHNAKIGFNDCTFGLIHNDNDDDKSGQSGLGIICDFNNNDKQTSFEMTNSEFIDLANGFLVKNDATLHINNCSFESIKQIFIISEQAEVTVDSCKATDSLWGSSKDLSRIRFENMDKKNISVARDGTGMFRTIQDALNYAEDGSMIRVKKGSYRASFVIGKAVTIIGESTDEGKTEILWKFEDSNVGIEINAKATLKNLNVICVSDVNHDTLENNRYYAAINITDDATLENMTIEGSVDDGIIISGNGVKPTIKQCDIHDNQGCGITQNNACANIIQSNIHENNQSGILETGSACGSYSDCYIHENNNQGITLRNHTSGFFCNCKIYDNKKNGIYILEEATPKIEKCKIFDNKTKDQCYPGIVVAGKANPTIVKCEIYGHLSDGIWCQKQAQGTYSNCNIYSNSAKGIELQDTASGTFNNCKIYDNKQNGFFITGEATPKIEKCKVYNNKTEKENYPGIVVSGNANPAITKCEIYEHLSHGIWCQEQAQGLYSECDIHNNNDTGIKLQDSASGTFSNCTIHNNTATGIKTTGNAAPVIQNCKVFSNTKNIDDQSGKADIDLDTLFNDQSQKSDIDDNLFKDLFKDLF